MSETVESINKQLRDEYSLAWNGQPIWRVVWSEDQIEKRHGTYNDYTPGGMFLRTVTEWREVPKYRQWIQEKFVLERLTVIPEINQDELVDKVSYEPVWVFEDNKGNPLPPKWVVAKIVVDSIYAATGKASLHKYVDPELDPEYKNKQLEDLQRELFANETNVGDALAHREAIVVPRNFKEN